MKSNFKLRLSGYLYLMLCLILISSCSTDVIEQEETQVRAEKVKKFQPDDSALESKSYTDYSCETVCVLPGGWDIPKKRGYKSVNVGKDSKEMSYTVYNTNSHFVVEVLYEITNESAKVDASITITVNGEEKISDRIKNGTTVTHSFTLPENYKPCDVINYHIKQVAYGEPVIFEGEYKLIPTCEETELKWGQKRYGGIVVYVLKPGDPGYDPEVPHGLVRSPITLPELLPWSEELMYHGPINNSIGGGMENTINIIAFQGEGNYAAKACGDFEVNGYTDWYLPNYSEIQKANIPYYNIDPFIIYEYWTSNSLSSDSAKPFNIDPWSPYSRFSASKQEKLYVIPFRAF